MDELLAAVPPGRLSEIVGPRSSGGSGLLVALLARATARGAQVALVDGADTFDPASAAAAGVQLGRLLWVRCGGRWPAAWSAADLLARCSGFGIVGVDLAALVRRDPAAAVRCLRLQRAAERSEVAVVIRAPHRLAGTAADLVIETRRVHACWQGPPRSTRLASLVSEARVVRCRAGRAAAAPAGGAWRIEWQL